MFFRKHVLPWTAADAFDNDELFQQWLRRKHKAFTDCRIVFVLLASACLLGGYVLEQRPLMLLTIVPLVLMLLISTALDRTEAAMDGQNKTDE